MNQIELRSRYILHVFRNVRSGLRVRERVTSPSCQSRGAHKETEVGQREAVRAFALRSAKTLTGDRSDGFSEQKRSKVLLT
ncbi:hypothetical protein AOLI_G00180580 [Acnodon oligacanthus]